MGQVIGMWLQKKDGVSTGSVEQLWITLEIDPQNHKVVLKDIYLLTEDRLVWYIPHA